MGREHRALLTLRFDGEQARQLGDVGRDPGGSRPLFAVR
jgi:hypothetical protein